MSYGIKIISNYNQIIDTTTFSGLVHDTFVAAGNSSGSKSYPELAGFTVFAVIQKYRPQPDALVQTSVSYSLGYPVVSWSPSGSFASPANALIVVIVK